jgi:hypothetical protein
MYLPFFLISLVPFLVGNILVSTVGTTLAVKIVYGILALLTIVAQSVAIVNMFYQVIGRVPSFQRTLFYYIDSYLGLGLAWGMGNMAFWVIDPDHYFISASGDIEHNSWLAALQLTSLAIEHGAGANHNVLPASLPSELFMAAQTFFYVFYVLAVLASGVEYLRDYLKEKEQEKQRSPPPPSSSKPKRKAAKYEEEDEEEGGQHMLEMPED